MKKNYLYVFCIFFTHWTLAQPTLPANYQQFTEDRAAPFLQPILKKNNRSAIVDAYLAEYALPKLGVKQSNWSGNVANCHPGTVSQTAIGLSLQRLNYYRKLLLLKPIPQFIDSLNAKCQQGALVCRANTQLNHFPPMTWKCYSKAAAQACANSNLAINYASDPRFFIDQNIEDAGIGNEFVGHRRWVLFTQAKNFGYGAVIDSNAMCTNALWVLPLNLNVVNDTVPEFVAMPPAGYCPKKLVTKIWANNNDYRWSFSPSTGSVDSAKVEMFDYQGNKVTLKQNKVSNGYGDNTLVFEPSGIDVTSTADAYYKVKITKVKIGSAFKTFEYEVVLIDNKKHRPVFVANQPTCGIANGSLSASFEPGFTKLKWSNGATTPDITNLADGKYFVSVTDRYGFDIVDSIEIKSKSLPLAITLTTKDATCGKNNAEINITTNAAKYIWNNGSTIQNLKDLTAGKYTVTVTSLDGCISTKEIDVVALPVGTAAVTTSNTTCSKDDGTAEATLKGGADADTYLWSNGEKTNKISALKGGDYAVSITDKNKCQITAQNKVIALKNPDLTIAKTDATCGKNNGSVTATSKDDVKFIWDNNEKTAVLSSLKPATYTVTVSNNDNCTATKFTTINALPIIILKTTAKNTSCNAKDGTAEITAANMVVIKSVLWSNNATTNKITQLAGGTFSVSVTDENQCVVTEKATVKGLVSPTVELGADVTLKKGEIATFDAGAGLGLTYLWSTNETTQTIKTNKLGTYSVTVTNADACSSSDQVSIKFLTSSPQQNNNHNIVLSPNPASEYIVLKVSDTQISSYRIINLLGKTLVKNDVFLEQDEVRIDINCLSKGMYYMIIEGNNYKKALPFSKL